MRAKKAARGKKRPENAKKNGKNTQKSGAAADEIAQEKRCKYIENKRKNARNEKIFPKGIDKPRVMW